MVSKAKVLAVVLMLASTALFAHERLSAGDIGVGVLLGEPTGVSAKYWLNDRQAIDAAVAWSCGEGGSWQVHGDWLWHNFDVIHVGGASGTPSAYYGLGALLKTEEHHNDDSIFGVRFPLGINYLFGDAPFELFGEVVPVLNLTPDAEVDLNVSVGLRYYLR
jgi:hypothetical protein